MKIALLGGTFDPVHNGHIHLARSAIERLQLDKLIFVPAFISPHKEDAGPIDSEERYRMLLIALEKERLFEVSRIEIDRGDISWTIDTLRYFKERFKNEELFFLAGSDIFEELRSWKNIDEILNICRFYAVERPGWPVENIPERVHILPVSPLDISSIDIRRRIKEGLSIKGLVPDKVREYIKKKGLYGEK